MHVDRCIQITFTYTSHPYTRARVCRSTCSHTWKRKPACTCAPIYITHVHIENSVHRRINILTHKYSRIHMYPCLRTFNTCVRACTHAGHPHVYTKLRLCIHIYTPIHTCIHTNTHHAHMHKSPTYLPT